MAKFTIEGTVEEVKALLNGELTEECCEVESANPIAIELMEQIRQWSREIEQLEDMIEQAYYRIDELNGE